MNDDELPILPGKVLPLKIGNKVYKSVYDWELSERDLKRASTELNESDERKEKCLRKLKEKLSNVSNIRFRQDDFYLLRFLRVRKYNVSKAYHNIKSFFEHRKENADLFTLPPELKSVQEINWCTALPYTDEEGRVLILLNFGRWNTHERTLEEMLQTASAACDLVIMNPKCQINGIVAIYDFKGMTARHITALLWNGRLFTLLPFALNGYPLRIKKWILVNANQFVRILYRIIKPLLPKKIAERTFILGSDMTELHQHVIPALLPKRLQGTLEEEDCDMTQHTFILGSDMTELHQYVAPALLPKRLQGTLEEEDCDMTQHVLNNLNFLKYERTFIYE